ncbi:LLM class flavin-dependent oxidoreductase [Streptomyces sp. cg40]|uniref:LLM class flavin-dependent oxidoreductase n=1 Tax=Streptomyces sp. cg40 TaxID=3419764 RepID=UPI003D035BC9
MNCDISVGVDPVGVGEEPLRIGVRVPPCGRADRVARTVRRAEELGFDQVWFPDSQLLWRDVFTTLTAAAFATERIGLGTVREGFSVRVADELLDPVPDGVPGELLVRSAHRFAFCTGHLGEPKPGATEWRRTGDRVVREPDGWFRFVDRIKDVIRRRGENVSSHEVMVPVVPARAGAGSPGPRTPLCAGPARVCGAPPHRHPP